jgi:hypothetical protein
MYLEQPITALLSQFSDSESQIYTVKVVITES